MPRGGYRPGSGRKKGQKDVTPRRGAKIKPEHVEQDKIRQLLSVGTQAKAKMYHEFLQRISQGGALSIAEKRLMDKIGGELEAEVKVDPAPESTMEQLEPLAYMLRVMNDPNESKDRRDRMAVASAPYVHPRKGEGGGKKEEKEDRAKVAGAGRFKASSPPTLKVVEK